MIAGRLAFALGISTLGALVSANTPESFQTQLPHVQAQPQAQAQAQAQVPLVIPGCKKFDCSNAGCGNLAPSTTKAVGTTILHHTSSPAHPEASHHGSTTVGGNGHTSSIWTVTRTSTLQIPGGTPTAPPCGHWTIVTVPETIIVGTETVIIKNPVVTAVGPEGSVRWSTTTATVTKTVTVCDTTHPVVPPVIIDPLPPVKPSKPSCTPGTKTPWTKVDIHKGKPWTWTFNDHNEGILKIQDAGYMTERVSTTSSDIGL